MDRSHGLEVKVEDKDRRDENRKQQLKRCRKANVKVNLRVFFGINVFCGKA